MKQRRAMDGAVEILLVEDVEHAKEDTACLRKLAQEEGLDFEILQANDSEGVRSILEDHPAVSLVLVDCWPENASNDATGNGRLHRLAQVLKEALAKSTMSIVDLVGKPDAGRDLISDGFIAGLQSPNADFCLRRFLKEKVREILVRLNEIAPPQQHLAG